MYIDLLNKNNGKKFFFLSNFNIKSDSVPSSITPVSPGTKMVSAWKAVQTSVYIFQIISGLVHHICGLPQLVKLQIETKLTNAKLIIQNEKNQRFEIDIENK